MSSVKRLIVWATLVVGICGAPAFAQKYEVHPYVGGLKIDTYRTLEFKNPTTYGLKGGMALTDNLMLEGNAAWWNQFNFKNYDYRTHAILYEVGGTYNFYQVRVRGVVPYVSLGVGGLTMNVMNRPNFNDHDAAVYAVPADANQ